jgi:hypothetical protein
MEAGRAMVDNCGNYAQGGRGASFIATTRPWCGGSRVNLSGHDATWAWHGLGGSATCAGKWPMEDGGRPARHVWARHMAPARGPLRAMHNGGPRRVCTAANGVAIVARHDDIVRPRSGGIENFI